MDLEKIGKFIKERRQEIGLTQKQLADMFGITAKAISKWECGQNAPDISLLNKLSSIEKDKFTKLLAKCKKNGNIKFIIIDTIEAIKSINYESWYKSNIDLSEGIWLGNGIGNQFTLRVTTNSRILRAEIDPGFGYIIKKGKAVLIKLISDE